jgi:hypothetical protein
VVHGQERQVLQRGEAEQGGAQERSALEVERPAGLLAHEALRLPSPPFGREAGEVRHGQRPAHERIDDLDRLAADVQETGAQGLVAAADLVHARRQGRDVEPAFEVDLRRHIEHRAARLPAVEEPDPLLGEGERQLAVPRLRQDGEHPPPAGRFVQALDRGGQLGDGGRFEDLAQWQLNAQGVPHPRDQDGA